MMNEKLGMKKAIFSLMIFFIAMTLNAQESPPAEAASSPSATPQFGEGESLRAESTGWSDFPWSLGIAAEFGADTREGAALGYGIMLDRYLFCPWLALGLRGTLSNNSVTVTSTEALLALRLYLPELKNFGGVFLFAQWGFGFAAYREEARDINTYLLDFTAGCRIELKGFLDRFYVEPFVRTGFPFVFSAGVIAGRRFNF